MNNFSKRILDLSPEKLALLTLRLKSKDGNVKSTPKIRRRSESKPQTLAPAQQRLWFLNQLEPDKTIYNAALAIRLTGSLNVRALEQSLSEIVTRHEALRTNFHTIEGQPVQVISPALPIKLPMVNFEEFSATEQEAQALRLATEIAQQPFNLSQGSLFRIVLLKLEQEKHMLFFTVHHIVFDAWSFGVLTRELMMLYKAFSTGKPSPFKELAIQYVDFTEWQWQMISGKVLETQLSYWKQQLDGLPQLLELPTDRPRPAVQTFRGTTQLFVLPPSLSQALKDLSYQEGVTLFMLLLATFKTLLHYYTGQDDIVVGSSVADRNCVETESLIGFFVNTLVLRTDLSHDPSFQELLGRVRKITLGAYAHQNLPFQKLVEVLQPERDLSHSPLFQVAFVLQNTPAEPIKLPDLTLVPLPVHNGNVAYDLILLIEETAEGLKGTVEYSTDLFNDTTIERLIRHFTTLLESIVANPKARLSQLNLLTKEECDQVLITFNDTARNYTEDKKCIHEMFEAHVERIPDSIAVVFQQEQLITYQELNRRANQLAHYLREIGIGPDVLVGICMERSLEMVVGILGILKAGGSYVPLDPAYPLDRLAFILEDTRIPVLLTQEHILENLPNYWATTICIDSDWEIITKQSEENLSSEVSLNNLAYVIYTSGTTGTPKGVMLEHKGVVNLVRWQSDNFNITSQSRISQFASYSFDAAVGETFMALLNGATLVMLDRNDLEPAKLILSINKQAITVLVLVPSILKELNPNLLSNHKITVVAVGEVCSPELALKWADKCKFMNAYGPTEYTVYSHIWQVDKEYVAKTNCVPIGLPIHNTKSYILDSHLNPVSIGVVGEIYISGYGLARGYLNRPNATAKQFIPNKFYESDVECFSLSLESACREIAEFKNNHIAHPYQVDEENKHRSLPKNISSEYIFSLVNSLDADIIEKTHYFINSFDKNQAVYEAFLRYLFEGFHCSYASCGINKDVLKLLLPYSDFQGLKGIDFGFGNSEIMQTLSNMGACMKGLDFNPFFIQNGRNLNLDVQMAKVDVSPEVFPTEIGITEGSYDFAISTLILDRLENPFNFIQNLFLVLKEGGNFAIQTLMPVIGVDDGNVQNPIIYTPEQHRITSGKSLKQDKASIISLLREVGAEEIKIYQLPYVVSSRDGIQEYEIWSFVGCKRKSQDGTFQKNHYQRLYKTGDLGKYLPNGDIQFCGRVDDLVKIRGFRIELGEIEDVLRTHPHVQEAIVFAKEDTTSDKRLVAYVLPSEEKRLLASQNFYKLPNNLEIAFQRKTEAVLLYEEIFEDQVYLKYGISINNGNCIFDVGANIGLFTLFAHQKCKNIVVYAFEPSPILFEKLRINTALYDLNARLFECGLSHENKRAKFTFYPMMPGMSSFYADEEEKRNIQAVMLSRQSMVLEHFGEQSEDVLETTFVSETLTCQLRTLSEVIKENKVQRIDLLKIDVEKSELDVLNGIEEDDWEKIQQLVLEVHDIEGRLSQITDLLNSKGYSVFAEQSAYFARTHYYNVYAKRRSNDSELSGYKKEETLEQSLPFLNKRDLLSISDLRSFLEDKLPRYMMPSAFVMLNTIPLMVNGKVNRQAFLELDHYSYVSEKNFVAPRTSVEKVLAEAWTQVLGLNQVGIHDNIFELGGDSILIVQILAKVNQAGLNLTISQFFKHQTIAELAPLASSTQVNPVAQDTVAGAVPLTPIQHWFFQQNLPEPHHYNQAILLQLRETLNVSLLEATIQSLLVHHDALRLRFRRLQAGWQQINAGSEENQVVLYVDLSMLPKVEQQCAMDVAAAETQASLNLSKGPLLRVVFFHCGSQQPSYLLVIIHHLAVDGVSWRILLEDLQLVYQNLLRGEQIQLSPKTTSFKQWAESLTQYAQSTQLQQELSYWLNKPRTSISHLPVDYPGGNNTEASARTVSVLLSQKETKLLLENVPLSYSAQINEVLLMALVEAVSHWTGEPSVLIDLEGHGRENIVEDVDLFRTVGWFTSLFPVWFNLTAISNLNYALRNVKEQLRSVPNRGIGYGIVRYLYEDEEIAKKLQTFPQAEISFNYLGQFDQLLPRLSLFEPTLSSYGPTHSLNGERRYLLEVNGYVIERQLHIDLTYSENIHKPTTIKSLADRFTEALRALIAHCQSFKAGCRTPSDFPLARTTLSKLDWDKLDSLIGYAQQVEDVYPLTPIQQGMLYHTLCAPESGIYVNQLSCLLRGKFDVSAFTRAWQEVVKRHSVLRTAFVWDGLDEPLQIVYSNLLLHLEEQDWRKLSSGECEQRLEAYRAEQYRNFKLSEAPLMRMSVVRVAEETYQFVWTFHHLLLDGWSVSLLLKEVFTLYKSSCESQNIKLEESYPFRNYIEWLQQQDLSKAEVFWRQTLKGFSKPKSLLIDRTPGALLKQATNYKEQKIYLSALTTATLQSLARQHQLTLNSIVQGAWALLLSHYTAEKDVVFGAIFSGRPTDLVGIELMVGLFINTLPVRVQVIPDASLLPWLKALQAQQVELRRFEYSPLVQIQGWSEVPRGVSLFESILVFENYPIDSSLLKQNGDLKIEQLRSLEQTNYPLTVVVVPGSELSLAISYSCEHFHASTIAQMLSQFKNLLEGIAMAPARCLSDLPLLTKAERRQQVVKWNNIKTIYPQDLCIHQLFEAQVERTPDSIAIVFEDQSLTYRELNTRANQLAYHLRTLGVQPEVVVGVFMERSLEMVIGLLGILKAGGAYVPLDPAYPKERLVFMLDNTQVPVLLTLQVFVEKLPEHKAQVLCLDADWEEIAQESQENPFNEVTVENLIYVIYTSGSTGRPKGVLGTHQASLNRFAWMWETYPFKTEEVCCQKTSINFVDSVWELFGPLLRGIKTVIIPEKTVKHIDEFIQTLADNHVSRLVLVPSLLRAMLDNDSNLQTRLSNLKMWISSGEPFSVDLLQHFSVSMPNKVLLNLYGSSEVAGDVTWYNTSLQIEEYFNPPIGRPIANTQAYILNNQLNPVALGVVGELYIGGTNLARGYLNRSDLTAEKFVPSPFSNNAGARLYKTGDLARYLPDGNIEFIDRIDRQVKLRGFRIELREIETLLSQHLSVQEAIVLVRKDESGDRRLVAYVVPKPSTSPAVSDLQNFLTEMLPEYMVPSGFVLLNSFPLTPNGKIDTQALLAMNGLEQELKQAFVAPRTEAERTIAEIWQQVLGIEKVGVNDNFFDRGGHSLLLVKVHGRLQELFKLNLSIVEMFQHPTISSLAEYISRNDDSTPSYQQNAARGKRRKDRNSRQRSR